MKRRKNLEKAIVLGLLLSTGVYGSAWAEGKIFSDNVAKIVETGDLVITDSMSALGFNGNVDVKNGDLIINTKGYDIANGIESGYLNNATLNILAKNVIINAGANGIITTWGDLGVDSNSFGNVIIGSEENTIQELKIESGGQGIDNKRGTVTIYGSDNSIIDIYSKHTSGDDDKQSAINVGSHHDTISDIDNIVILKGGSIKLKADGGDGITNGALSDDKESRKDATTNLISKKVTIEASIDGINNVAGTVTLDTTGNNIINAQQTAVHNSGSGTITISATAGTSDEGVSTLANYDNYDNELVGGINGVQSDSTGTTNVIADNNNIIAGTENGILSDGDGIINVTAGNNNYIAAGNTDNGYGSQYAVYALDDGVSFKGSTVNILANGQNALLGAVYTKGSGVDNEDNVVATNTTLDADTNIVKSAASIANAGGLTNTTVISALYAEAGAQINVSGENNTILSYADYDKPEILERAVWAYDRADITIDGATTISTDSYEKSSNSNDIAIAAGTGTGLTEEIVSAPVADRSTVTLTYNNYANGAKSNITGNILSAYTGTVDIKGVNDTAGIDVTGDLLAGNNGELNLNLGNGGILKGRADDYGDAGVVNNGHANTFKDPAFSSEIHKGGVVNLTMGDNSRWNVTGQSWITSITTDHEEENAEHNHIIDLISANTDRNEAAHALTVYNFDGNAIFNMSLDADRSISDMLYIKNADGNYIINVVDAVTEDDIYAVKSDGGTFDGLRFATVGKGSTASFKAITYDQGFNNIEYMIGTDSYNESDENHHYNGESLDAEKPGDETVDEFFKNEGTPGSTTESTNGIATASLMLAAANEAGNAVAGTTAETDDLTDVEVNIDETTNFKLIGVKNTDLSDGGETILNMSRANYSNAIYMDRLNKRLGEARYINDDPEEDEGMWVRIRHDRIGKDDAFRSQNTMYQLGYDKRQECDNGERRVGFAVDYMHGDTGYTDIAGKGEIDRYGLWLYDTWMGDKGHYADYIAKWGHLDNEFEIYAPTTGQRIDGDYSNNVFSVSAEYGRKKDIGNDWYFEPQAQLQLARVTGADYTTSQGTKVSVDGINSLIGRAGFRIGKDFGEEKQSTLYFKADVLHEFLGDQDISAMDKTTNGNWSTISYENEGTWYDIGIGYAAMMSKSSYAFIDLEQSFGNDNDDTYQINAGVRWTF